MVMKDMARRERRSSRARREVTEDGLAIDERTANPRDRADDALDEARALDRERRMGIVLRERISRSARTLQVFDLRREGIEDCDEIAKRCDCKVSEIYDANRQIAYHAAGVLAEQEQAEAARMKELRARASPRKGASKPPVQSQGEGT
jgi:hypothetical protein